MLLFTAKLIINSAHKSGYQIQLFYSIHVANRFLLIINKIKEFFGVVYFIISKVKDSVYFEVTSLKDLKIINDHFYNFPLNTSKLHKFYIFVYIYNMLLNKQHLNKSGLLKQYP